MIEIEKIYTIKFTEQQAKELYEILKYEREQNNLGVDKDLVLVYNELKDIFSKGTPFSGGIR